MKKLLVILIFFSNYLHSQPFFVSKSGSDNNPGTERRPFATLVRARDAVREIKKIKGILKGGITIWIYDGVYLLQKGFELTEEDSGEPDSPIIYRAVNGEDLRLIGGVTIDGKNFEKLKDERILNRIKPEYRDKIFCINLKKLGITNFGEFKQWGHSLPVVNSLLELFVGHKPMQLAKYPNSGGIPIGNIIDCGSIPRDKDYSNRGGAFKYTDERHKKWLLNDDIWIYGTLKWGFADDFNKIEKIDTLDGTVKLAYPHLYGLGTGEPFNQYIVYNVVEELDSPGEYYVDRKDGILYLYPESDLRNSIIEVSLLEEPLVSCMNVSNVIFRDIIFEVSRGIGIYIEGGENVSIAGCTIRNLGTTGIMIGQGAKQKSSFLTVDDYEGFPVSKEIGSLQSYIYQEPTWDRKGGKNHAIIGCDIYNTGTGGIILSGGNKKELINGNCSVKNCKIYNFQRRNKAQFAGINVDGCGNIISHNEIYNAEHLGIYVHGNENIFEYNNIHHVAMDCNDGSAWYLGRDPSDRGNIIRYNFFHHIGRTDRKWIMGVYFDDASCDALVFGNVFYQVGTYGAVYSNAGQDLVIKNNIFIDCSGPAFHMNSMWFYENSEREYFFAEKGIYRKRLTKLLDIKKPPYSKKYPNLVNWLDPVNDGKDYEGMYPKRNIFSKNLIYKFSEVYRPSGLNIECELKDNYVTNKDPGFINEKKMNFALSNNSPIYRLIPGFEKIPFDEIGLYKDEYRKTLNKK
jgi:hypothetical protein